MNRKTAVLLVLGTSVLATSAFSQQNERRPGVQVQVNPAQPAQPQQQPQQRQPIQGQNVQGQPQQASAPVTQQSMAACVALSNQEEVSLAEFASDKTKNDDVKDFTKHVISDHQAFLKKLQKFTPEASRNSLDEGSRDGSGRAAADDNRRQPARPIQQTAGQQPAPNQQPVVGQQPQPQGAPMQQVDMIQLHREIAQQCLADSKKRMSKEDADKFDKCFIGHQIVKHEAMKTTLSVLQRHASGEFAQLLAEGIDTTDKHLKQAEKIMDGLMNEKSDRRVTSDN